MVRGRHVHARVQGPRPRARGAFIARRPRWAPSLPPCSLPPSLQPPSCLHPTHPLTLSNRLPPMCVPALAVLPASRAPPRRVPCRPATPKAAQDGGAPLRRPRRGCTPARHSSGCWSPPKGGAARCRPRAPSIPSLSGCGAWAEWRGAACPQRQRADQPALSGRV